MLFKKGFSIKPKEVQSNGIVLFTDGTNDVYANELACVAYGYRFNKDTGTCVNVRLKGDLEKVFKSNNNHIKGGTTGLETTNVSMVGSKNRTQGQNRNISISGEKNVVGTGMINAAILGGKFAKVIRQGEVAIGGGRNIEFEPPSAVQKSEIQCSGQTTDDSRTNLTAQGDGVSLIPMIASSIVFYEMFLTAVVIVTGGGLTAGQFQALKLTGTVVTDVNLNLTISQTETTIDDTIPAQFPISVSMVQDGDKLAVEVVGASTGTIYWSCTLNFYEQRILADIETI